MATVAQNLDCLKRTLEYNVRHNIGFFRITSDLVPFASHPVCRYDWGRHFAAELRALGRFIHRSRMRISMHPDQFVLINARSPSVVASSTKELVYHARVLDLMGLDRTAKIQIHVGGIYGDRTRSQRRFIAQYHRLPGSVRRRLVIENDDRNYAVADCLAISRATGVPVLFDDFHHSVLNHGEDRRKALQACGRTWHRPDGVPMVDYSSQQPGRRQGAHALTLDPTRFRRFLQATGRLRFDLMLEIKDKELSAGRALQILERVDARAKPARTT